MEHDATLLIERLEQCEPKNESWRIYMAAQAADIQTLIAQLRRFASLKPGPVCERVTEKANGLQSRLNRVLRA